MRVLVTGGAGYIGSHTIIELLEAGHDVVSIDNYINSSPVSYDRVARVTGKQCTVYEGDLRNPTDLDNLLMAHGPFDGIIHFAALKSVEESQTDPLGYLRANVSGLINLLQAVSSHPPKSIIFSSSCTVYGQAEQLPVDEQTPWQVAESTYGLTKQLGEQILGDSTQKLARWNTVFLRYFNPAGAHPSGSIGEDAKLPSVNLVPVIMEAGAGLRESITVFGTNYDTADGSCVRDYIHISDLAAAHVKALDYAAGSLPAGSTEVFNLGVGQGVSVLEMVHSYEQLTGTKLPVILGPRRAGDIEAIYADNQKAKKVLGWSPRYNINDIISTALAWEKNRSTK